MDDFWIMILPLFAILALMLMSVVEATIQTNQMEACVAAGGTWKDGNCDNN